MNIQEKNSEIWFLVGSQHLYGDETLEKVRIQAEEIASYINEKCHIDLKSLKLVNNTLQSYPALV